jgi:hypothetical protein
MRPSLYPLILAFPLLLLLASRAVTHGEWVVKKNKNYFLCYKKPDRKNAKEYKKFIDNGIISVQTFFGESYKNKFYIYVHPNRQSLDAQWQKDWKIPNFKSECWMVASGIANKLDMISPKVWDKEACEHIYANTIKTQQLIAHELIHVYHGQQNASPDFSDVTGIDWFVEGLATYASGQCDSLRIVEIKNAISENKVPQSLDKFWTGVLKYGLSGSLVMYIDNRYGRIKLKQLLKFNKKSEILSLLNITEPELLSEWKIFIEKL